MVIKICSVDGCNNKVKALGMCNSHYSENYRSKSIPCFVEGCEKPSWARDLCGTHYEYWRTHGNTDVDHSITPAYYCNKCYTQKKEKDFWTHSKTTRGHQYWCKTCISEERIAKGRKPDAPITRRKYKLREYKLTVEDFEKMYENQNGKCAICGIDKLPWEPSVGFKGRSQCLSIDHDHISNKVRGLLCHNCNVAIGHMRDNPELLRKAADYLDGN